MWIVFPLLSPGYRDGCMDGRMNGWRDGCIIGVQWVDEWMGGWTDGHVYGPFNWCHLNHCLSQCGREFTWYGVIPPKIDTAPAGILLPLAVLLALGLLTNSSDSSCSSSLPIQQDRTQPCWAKSLRCEYGMTQKAQVQGGLNAPYVDRFDKKDGGGGGGLFS